jgi:hypothetical protein
VPSSSPSAILRVNFNFNLNFISFTSNRISSHPRVSVIYFTGHGHLRPTAPDRQVAQDSERIMTLSMLRFSSQTDFRVILHATIRRYFRRAMILRTTAWRLRYDCLSSFCLQRRARVGTVVHKCLTFVSPSPSDQCEAWRRCFAGVCRCSECIALVDP